MTVLKYVSILVLNNFRYKKHSKYNLPNPVHCWFHCCHFTGIFTFKFVYIEKKTEREIKKYYDNSFVDVSIIKNNNAVEHTQSQNTYKR